MWSISAVAVLTSLLATCLLSDPAEYEAPDQTTVPVLDGMRAQPPLTQILDSVSNDDKVPFTVPFRSEDRGEELVVLLYVDFALAHPLLQYAGPLPPSTFDDEREIRIDWTVHEVPAGCHQLSLVVTHESNVNFYVQPAKLRRTEDAAILTWWVDVEGSGDSLGECPRSDDPGEG